MFTENISYMPQGISEINTNTNEVEQTEVMDFEGNYEIDDFGVSLGVVNSTQESQSTVDENLDKETESEEIEENDEDSQDNKIDINLSQQPIEKDVEMAVDEDIKIGLFKSLYDYRPINIFISDNEIQEEKKIENCIVVEKLGEDVVAVERLGFRPSYIKGEKGNLVVKNSNLSDYMQWLKADMIKRYNNSITEEEFNEIKKYIIVEDESEKVELNSNEVYMTRKEALSRVSSKYEVVIDLTMDNCHIKFIDEDNTNCEIDVKGLGYEVSSSVDWIELISTKLEVLKGRNIIFTGLAGKEKLNSDLRECFNVKGNKSFESLAWEI